MELSPLDPPARTQPLQVLALEPFYGGSHKAFLDGWSAVSRHRFTVVGLPPHSWKWRMRHGALTCAERAAELCAAGPERASFDVVFASDMLSLAELRGLAPPAIAALPAVVYFHENQLTYPVRVEAERDLHFAFTNLTTALAADAIWWNSTFHRDDFLAALPRFLKRMPDHRPTGVVERIRERSTVLPPGVAAMPDRVTNAPRRPGPLRILWASRWEFDKNPELFFAALAEVDKRQRAEFRLSVIGEQFRDVPAVFARARKTLADRIDRWGYVESRPEYIEALLDADVFVSTADHEFFGIAAVEAMAAGCRPLFPERLAYPELLTDVPAQQRGTFFYDGSVGALADRLADLAARVDSGIWDGDDGVVRRAIRRFEWSRLGPRLDDALAMARRREPWVETQG